MTHSFYHLSPDIILSAVEDAGYQPTGAFIQLNSYENRVFSISLEQPYTGDDTQLIAKFYRPQRWSLKAILEEHAFLEELHSEGIPVPPAIKLQGNSTCIEVEGLYFSLFPKIYGRLPQELLSQDYTSVGGLLARLHNIGAKGTTLNRPELTTENYGWPAIELLEQWIDPSVIHRYQQAGEKILDFLDQSLNPSAFIRIHGDCHRGNLLHNDKGFFFVDFDDFCNGPEAQDLWMLFGGKNSISPTDKALFLNGYEQLRSFPDDQWQLMEPLRGLRIIHYSAWIAKRWKDPSFPKLFPQFQDYIHWAEEAEALEQISWNL